MGIRQYAMKHKSIIAYAVFGVLTTLVNVVTYWVCSAPFDFGVVASSVIAWIVAVAFAYVTNRTWVFQSKAQTTGEIVAEAASFFAGRLATGLVDWVGMYVAVEVLHQPDVIMKALMNVIVIVLNYLFSKLIVFKDRR